MSLKARTTYKLNSGRVVHIAGLTRAGDGSFWSIEGDHYTPEGRRISLRRCYTPVGEPQQYERWVLEVDAGASIDMTSANATDPWWNGVIT